MRTLIVAFSVLALLLGLVPAADATDAQTWTVSGIVTRADAPRQVVKLRPDSGPEMTLITKGIPAETVKALKIGDRVTATVREDPGRPNKTIVRADSISSSSGSWQRVPGVVRDVQGSTLTMRTDDGRRLIVDMSKVSPEIQQNLQRGDRVTIAAHDFTGRNQVRAEFIQKDSSAGGQAVAQTQNSRTVTGTVNGVNVNGEVVRMKPDGGAAELRILTTGVPGETWKSLKKGDKITARVHDAPGPGPTVQAETIGLASAASASGAWQQIHGVVRDVQGSTLTLRADDGRRLHVDMSKVSPEIQASLKRDEKVTVATHDVTGNNVKAEFIQKDSSAGVQPSASPAQPVDEKSWQKIHGAVQSVTGTTLSLKADDGRMLNVDMKDVNPAVQKALTSGEGVTVTGFYRGDDRNVTARFIQQDSSASK